MPSVARVQSNIHPELRRAPRKKKFPCLGPVNPLPTMEAGSWIPRRWRGVKFYLYVVYCFAIVRSSPWVAHHGQAQNDERLTRPTLRQDASGVSLAGGKEAVGAENILRCKCARQHFLAATLTLDLVIATCSSGARRNAGAIRRQPVWCRPGGSQDADRTDLLHTSHGRAD